VVRVVGTIACGERDSLEVASGIEWVDHSPGCIDESVVIHVGVAAVADAVRIRIALIEIRDIETIVFYVANAVFVRVVLIVAVSATSGVRTMKQWIANEDIRPPEMRNAAEMGFDRGASIEPRREEFCRTRDAAETRVVEMHRNRCCTG